MVRSTLALAAVLAVASTSLAGDLVTPSVFVGSDSGVTCRLLNITKAPLSTEIRLTAGFDGTALFGQWPDHGRPGKDSDYGKSAVGQEVYCRFVNTSKSKVRAALTAFSLVSGDFTNSVVAMAQ